jgi:DNA polymerase-3 subunit delta'
VVGQTSFINNIDYLVSADKFPRFSIIVGQEGSGKKRMANYISSKLGCVSANYGIGVDDIRQMIVDAYKVSMPMVYILPDADKMSPAAKNALLKVTEEPPQNAYFILTLTDLNNTLGTIRSRGTVFYMDPYSVYDIESYCKSTHTVEEDDLQIINDLCETPGEVDKIVDMGTTEFYSYAEKVVDNVATVSGSNSFKIAAKIRFKESDTGTDKYDLRLFWKAFMSICTTRLREDPLRYSVGIRITSKYLQELRITGINKQSTFDCWLLDIRKEWM